MSKKILMGGLILAQSLVYSPAEANPLSTCGRYLVRMPIGAVGSHIVARLRASQAVAKSCVYVPRREYSPLPSETWEVLRTLGDSKSALEYEKKIESGEAFKELDGRTSEFRGTRIKLEKFYPMLKSKELVSFVGFIKEQVINVPLDKQRTAEVRSKIEDTLKTFFTVNALGTRTEVELDDLINHSGRFTEYLRRALNGSDQMDPETQQTVSPVLPVIAGIERKCLSEKEKLSEEMRKIKGVELDLQGLLKELEAQPVMIPAPTDGKDEGNVVTRVLDGQKIRLLKMKTDVEFVFNLYETNIDAIKTACNPGSKVKSQIPQERLEKIQKILQEEANRFKGLLAELGEIDRDADMFLSGFKSITGRIRDLNLYFREISNVVDNQKIELISQRVSKIVHDLGELHGKILAAKEQKKVLYDSHIEHGGKIDSVIRTGKLPFVRSKDETESPSGIRVLSIDGGGVKGIIPALVLESIEKKTGGCISDLFDIIIGTSTGGIISLMLTRPEERSRSPIYSAAMVVEKFKTLSEKIFQRKSWLSIACSIPAIRSGREGVYPTTELEAQLKEYMRDYRFSEALSTVMITTTRANDGEPRLFSSQESAANELLSSDLAMATSAAPLVFPKKTLSEYGDFIDGGVLYNNPTELALKHIKDNYEDDTPVFVVSLGTGFCKSGNEEYSLFSLPRILVRKGQDTYDPKKPYSGGVMLRKYRTQLIQGAEKAHASTECEYSSLHFRKWIGLSKREDSPYHSGVYVRFNPDLERHVRLDDYNELDYLKKVATGMIADRDTELNEICKILSTVTSPNAAPKDNEIREILPKITRPTGGFRDEDLL